MRLDAVTFHSILWSVLIGLILRWQGARLRGSGPADLRPWKLLKFVGAISTLVLCLDAAVDLSTVGVLRGGAEGGEGSQDRVYKVRINDQLHNYSIDIIRFHYEQQQRTCKLYPMKFRNEIRNVRLDELEVKLIEYVGAMSSGDVLQVRDVSGTPLMLKDTLLRFYDKLPIHKEHTVIKCFCMHQGVKMPNPPNTLGALDEFHKRMQGQPVEIYLTLGDDHQVTVTRELIDYWLQIAHNKQLFHAINHGKEDMVTLERLNELYKEQFLFVKLDNLWIIPDAMTLSQLRIRDKPSRPIEINALGRWQFLTDDLLSKLDPPVREPALGFVLAFTHIAGYCYHGYAPGPGFDLCLDLRGIERSWSIDGLWPLEAQPGAAQMPRVPDSVLQDRWEEPDFNIFRQNFNTTWIKLTNMPVDRPVHEFSKYRHSFPPRLKVHTLKTFCNITQRLVGQDRFLDTIETNEHFKTLYPSACPKQEFESEVRRIHLKKPMLFCRETEALAQTPATPRILTGVGLCYSEHYNAIDCPSDHRDTCKNVQLFQILPKRPHNGYP